MPRISRASVVLPEPDSPAIAVTVGRSAGTVIEKLSSAVRRRLSKRPPPKRFVTVRISRSGAGVVTEQPSPWPSPRGRGDDLGCLNLFEEVAGGDVGAAVD